MIRLVAAVRVALSTAAHGQLLEADADPAALARLLLEEQPGVASVSVLRAGSLREASVFRPDTKTPVADWPEPRAPMFEIGSVSKVFTGLLLARHVPPGGAGRVPSRLGGRVGVVCNGPEQPEPACFFSTSGEPPPAPRPPPSAPCPMPM